MDPADADQNCIYLLVGQRGAGKTSYAKRLIESQPEFHLMSRDDILVRKFGTADTDPDDGTQEHAAALLLRLVRFKLSTGQADRLILDMWTERSGERKRLVELLRKYGASRVVALYFVTPVELVNLWFWLKPGVAKSEERRTRRGQGLLFFPSDGPARDYELFHQLARDIDSDGFDEVIRVDPRKELIVLV
jgi:hypothetical protein